MCNPKNEINKQNYNRLRHREQTGDRQWGEELGDYVKEVKGLRSTNWQLQNSQRDVKCSIGDVVNNTVITMFGAR